MSSLLASTHAPRTLVAFPQRRSRRGFSLVEVAATLSVLTVLVGSLAPVVWESVNTARTIRAKADLAVLAGAVVTFQRDVGAFVPAGRSWSKDPSSGQGGVSLLAGRGEMPRPGKSAGRGWVEGAPDPLDEHLRYNLRRYPHNVAGGGASWKGPYVSTEVGADPWGYAYLLNARCLAPLPPGTARDCAAFVISAGPNGTIETPFDQPVGKADAYGDDLAVRIK